MNTNFSENKHPWFHYFFFFYFQELELSKLRIPEKANEIFITGGERIVLGQKSFDRMPALTLLHIEGTRTLVMEKQSFRNLTSPSLLIQIQNCDHLSIKTGAFENVQVRVSQTVQTDEQNGVLCR